MTTIEADRARLEQQHQAVPAPLPTPADDTRTLVIDGVEYEATSVGRRSLTGDAAGLGSTLSGEHRLRIGE